MSLSEGANDEPAWESPKNGYWCSVWLCRLVGSCRIGGNGVVSLLWSCGRMSFLSKISVRSHASMSCLSGCSEEQQDRKFVFVFYRKRIDFVCSHLASDVRRCFTRTIGCPIAILYVTLNMAVSKRGALMTAQI